ncbi:MAG: PhzF family phenazine biosynthesis protein [Nocardiopsaceae bacterium]|jgi:PhzF family phenazine biosynthesis protein|nr:PhzF family phenazine biosynthesis protein [Nocardiopsaceae bacterium]
MQRPFSQVDVFSSEPFLGNPVAVVLDGSGMSTEQMQLVANWTNLSETTFLLPADEPGADYKVRIFTPSVELPFAGHPTLGSCHAWLESGNRPRQGDMIVQQCGAGLVRIRRSGGLLGFAAPPLIRSGAVDGPLLEQVAGQLQIAKTDIVAAQWADNGPGWIAILMDSAQAVLDVRPGDGDLDVGLAGPYPPGSECAFEVRAFFPAGGRSFEDPVTGSFNASLAQWLLSSGRATAPYVVSQGTVLGRRGRVHIDAGAKAGDAERSIWVSGATVTRISGQIEL